jgi:hypothetical protein
LSQPDDGGIGQIEMFLGAVYNGAHALGHGVVLLRDRPDTGHERLLLSRSVDQVIVVQALEATRGVRRVHQHVTRHAALPFISGKRSVRIVLDRKAHGVVVIDGDGVEDGSAPALGGDKGELRQDMAIDADMLIPCICGPHSDEPEAIGGGLHIDTCLPILRPDVKGIAC